MMKKTFALVMLALCALCADASTRRTWLGWSDTTARTVAASSTQYTYLLGPGAAFSATESARTQTAPSDGTISNLYVVTISAQPVTGSLVCNVRVAGADADAYGDSVTVTIAASAAAGTFKATQTNPGPLQWHSDFAAVAREGQALTLKCVNNATGASAGISEVRFRMRGE